VSLLAKSPKEIVCVSFSKTNNFTWLPNISNKIALVPPALRADFGTNYWFALLYQAMANNLDKIVQIQQ